MTQITLNNARPAFSSTQTPVVYQQANAPQYPEFNGFLAPCTSSTAGFTTYASGRLLAQYTAAHAPTAALIGAYVNYDPASSNADQAIPVAVISDQFAQGLTGILLTNTTTATATMNTVNVAPLKIGTTLYENAIVNGNESAVVTGFNSYFVVDTLETITVGQTPCDLITIQGVQ